ncbi:serine/threonine-protein kinase mtor [Anaeramoeba ignava]|uniref:Serine/threonine-protein kinase TOR n=1 Tax=Anaeramoeba ignava TaxID=1746090 RepID=A0A9Q0LNT3_ANAIG|nr:serine/threonine-protein kinase mtor [Anaeramoeba ignava]
MSTINQGKDNLLNQLFQELKKKNEEIKRKAAENLKLYVKDRSMELSGEAFTVFMNDLNRRIFEFVNSTDINEKLGGVIAIDELIDVRGEDNALKMTRFSNYLRHVLATNDPAIMKTAAKTLSHLAKVGGALTADFICSYYFLYSYSYIFDVIWNALKHNKVNIREAAVVTLRAGLKLINSREKKLRDQWYFKIYSEAQKYIKQNNSDSIHGALLVFGELLSITDSFIESYFGEVCDLIFSFRDHKDKTVRKAVIYLIPLLAKFFPSDFVNRYLDISIKHTLNSLKKDYIDKTTIFQAIGDLSLAVNQQIMPYIKDIMQKIRDSLVVTKKKNYCPEAMICVAQLSSSLKTQLVEEIKKNNILDSMFNSGLSEILIRSLSQISRNIPDLKLEIQERVLNTLSIILSRKPYFTPKSVIESTVNTNTRLNDSLTIAIDSSTPQVILALQTLRTFDFGTNDLLEFVRDKVLVYLESETGEIRTEATTTCIKILVCSVSEKKEIGSFREKQVENILHKVLMLGIIDPDNRNRYAVFDSLDQTLDPYLSKTSNLATLFVALNDEMFEIRELAITIIGRLSERNPSDVMPTLRKTLIQLLSELEYTQDLRLKEESARSLVHFIRSTKQLNKAYCKSILRDLLPKLTSLAKSKTHSGIFMQVLAAIGELGMIGREHIAPYVDQLVALILETLQEQSDPVHRKIALYTLGQLIESTGWVIDPYVKFPRLMNTLLILLRTGRDEQIKKDVLRIMGMLGALDPYRQKMVVSHISDVNENVAANAGRSGGGVAVNGTGKRTKSRGGAAKVTGKRTEDEISGRVGGKGGKDGAKKNEKAARGNREKTSGTTDPILPGICLSFDKYYASVAIDALMKILADPTLATHHTMVVQALMFICKSLGTRIVPFLGQIMPSFLSAAKKSEPRLREFLFQQLPGIVTIVRHNIREYTDEILTLIREFWGDDVLPYSVQLLEQLSELSAAKFKVHLPSLLPLMFNSMLGENNDERKVTQIVLRALEQFGRNLDDAAHLVVPVLIKLFEQVNSPIGVRIAAIKTLGGLAIRVGLGDYSSRIMHSLTRVLCVNHGELRTAVMETFCSIAIQLQREYIIYVPMVGAVLAANRIHYHPYDTIVIKLLKNEPLPSVSLSQTSDSSLQNTSEKSRTGRFGESITNDNADDSMVLLSSELSLDMEISQLNSDSGDPLAISGGPNSEKKGISLSGKDGEESRKPPKKLYVNQAVLKKAWDATARSTREDWEEWIRKFAVELLYQSPSPVLRSCSGLAQIYHPLSRRLFYAGFLSCWNELYDQYQDELVHSLETAFIADSIPPDILQLLLNLTKFMEHVDKTLPINIGTLSELAIKCHAYPLALRYKELEFQTNPSGTIEAFNLY